MLVPHLRGEGPWPLSELSASPPPPLLAVPMECQIECQIACQDPSGYMPEHMTIKMPDRLLNETVTTYATKGMPQRISELRQIECQLLVPDRQSLPVRMPDNL